MPPARDLDVLQVIVVGWLVLPVIPLAIAWRRDRRERSRGIGPRWALVVVTISQAWLLSLFVLPETIGPNYSAVRWAVILTNLGAMLATAVSAAILRRPMWGLLAATSLWIVISWLYVLVVSSAV